MGALSTQRNRIGTPILSIHLSLQDSRRATFVHDRLDRRRPRPVSDSVRRLCACNPNEARPVNSCLTPTRPTQAACRESILPSGGRMAALMKRRVKPVSIVCCESGQCSAGPWRTCLLCRAHYVVQLPSLHAKRHRCLPSSAYLATKQLLVPAAPSTYTPSHPIHSPPTQSSPNHLLSTRERLDASLSSHVGSSAC